MTADLLEEYPITLEIPVVWGDMDSMQHMNNVVYLRYFESVRSAYFHEMGAFVYKNKTNLGPILYSTYCRFRIPLTYPDKVTVGGRIDDSDIGDDRFTMRYAVLSHQHGKMAAEGDGVIVYVDYSTGKKAPIPDPMRQAIADIERRRKRG